MLDNRWTKEQAEAITAGDCNLLVAAAAGAGKTAVLVERIIQKITAAENPIDIDRLLVMTFTKAAATEMRERIAQAIADELERDPQNRNIRRQLTLLNKAGITTVHSFCLEVIRSNFQIIDLDPGFRISDETEASLLKLEVLNELFEEIYEQEKDNQAFYELLECYGNNRDDQVLQGMVLNLYDFVQSSPRPEAWLKKMTGNFQVEESMDFGQTPWGKVLLASIGIEFEGLRKKMNKAVSMLDKADGLEKYLPVFEEDLNFIKHVNGLYLNGCIPGWDQLYGIIKGFEFGKLPPAGQEADKDVQEKVKEIRDDVKKCLNRIKDGIFSAASEEIAADLLSLYPSMKCLVGLALEFKERYGIKKKEKSIVDFNDLEHFCLQILTEQSSDLEAVSSEFTPSKVALVYKQRFAEILVDEYQDSNLVQEIIIRMISREDLQEPNVFMVGDVKQSIYKFRQARPELFLEKYNSYSFQTEASKRKIILAKNFRSREEVIEAVNFIFKQIMSARVGELDYTDQEVLYPGAAYPEIDETELFAGGEVEFHLIQTKENIGNAGNTADNTENDQDINENYIDNEGEHSPQGEMLDNLQLEARLAARRIQELMKPDDRGRRFAVFDKDRKSYRSIEYKDIVILLRTTKNWADIFAEELALQGIPAFADTGTGFFKTSEVQVILALLQIIDNPLQDIPLLAVLRSPLFSFSTEELAELRLLKSHGLFYESLQAATNPKAILFMAKLKKWRDESFYLSTDQLLWQIYSETGYYGIAGALPGGEQRQANLRVLFERARQYEETSFKGLFNFINFIDKLKSSERGYGECQDSWRE